MMRVMRALLLSLLVAFCGQPAHAAHCVADMVVETSTTTGTGALTTSGTSVTGARTIGSACSVGDTLPYTAYGVDASYNRTGEWETGIGTYSATNTLTRTTIYASSNSGSAVSFSSGTKVIALAPLAHELGFTPATILASDSANSTTTLANVSGMSFSAAANAVYEVTLVGAYQTAATTTGIGLALDIPSGSVYGLNLISTSATAIAGTNQIADAATAGASTGVTTAATNTPIYAKWLVVTSSTAGTVQLMMRSEIASSAATLKASVTAMYARRLN